MPSVTIGSTIIDFPNSARSPNWAQPVIQFAEAVETALATVVGPFDIGQRVMNIDTRETDSNIDVTDGAFALAFPINPTLTQPAVRSAFVRYAVYRKKGTNAAITETGNLLILYNPDSSPVFMIEQDKIGDANVSFTITTTGQVQVSFTDTNLGVGGSVVGRLTYTAQGLKQS
jgi:hypothetical protein